LKNKAILRFLFFNPTHLPLYNFIKKGLLPTAPPEEGPPHGVGGKGGFPGQDLKKPIKSFDTKTDYC
jgi:hypothetical protein